MQVCVSVDRYSSAHVLRCKSVSPLTFTLDNILDDMKIYTVFTTFHMMQVCACMVGLIRSLIFFFFWQSADVILILCIRYCYIICYSFIVNLFIHLLLYCIFHKIVGLKRSQSILILTLRDNLLDAMKIHSFHIFSYDAASVCVQSHHNTTQGSQGL